MRRPAWTKSVRFQLTFWYVTTLALILLLAAALLFAGLRRAAIRETDRTLANEAAQIARLLTAPAEGSEADETPERPDPAAVLAQTTSGRALLHGVPADPLFLRLARADSRATVAVSRNLDARGPLAAALAALPPPARPGPVFVFAGPDEETRVRCLTVRVPKAPYLLQAATPWDGAEDLLTRQMLGIVGAIVLFLLLSGVGSWLLVGRAFRPMESIVTEAERLTAERPAPMHLRPQALSDNEIGRLAEALNRMLARLSGAFAAQRQFTADASHELRTPLTILRGEMELALARDRTDAEYRRTLQSSLEETRRMGRIVDSLALLARGDADRDHAPALPRAPVSLTLLAEETVRAMTRAAEEKGLSVVTRGEDGVSVLGDPEALSRVLRNLLDNAIRCTPSGGRITVTTEQDAHECRLSVADTGVGIAPGDLPFVFDRFYRADKARVNDGGSGLGLSIAQSIVAAHGGQVEAESAPGVGSRFTATLPRISKL